MEPTPGETVLDDPIRRALYRLILAAEGPVSRNDAADALGLPKSTAAAHLERMAQEGLLAVSLRKTTGRTGPGSGRPAAFYSAATPEVTLSVPPRRYELMGDLLAGAVEDIVEQEPRLADRLRAAARERGRALGAAAGGVEGALRDGGYEPVRDERGLALANCPFHRLSRSHRDVVCLLNGALLEGVVEGAGDADATVESVPDGSPCCARICRPAVAADGRAQPAAHT